MPDDNNDNILAGRTGLSDKQRDKKSLWQRILLVLDWEEFLSASVGREGIIFGALTTVGGAVFSCALVMFAFIMVIIAAVQLYKMLW